MLERSRDESSIQGTHDIMANKKEDSPAKEKHEPKHNVRDLTAKKEVKGGARNAGGAEKRPPAKTGEIDFMNWD